MDKPDGLGPSGAAFWDAITHPDLNLVLRPDEHRMLDMACRTLDLIDTLQAKFAEDPEYIVKGSTGQPTINPLINQVDRAQARFQSVCKQLQIPDLDEDRANQRAESVAGDMRKLGNLSWQSRRKNA